MAAPYAVVPTYKRCISNREVVVPGLERLALSHYLSHYQLRIFRTGYRSVDLTSTTRLRELRTDSGPKFWEFSCLSLACAPAWNRERKGRAYRLDRRCFAIRVRSGAIEIVALAHLTSCARGDTICPRPSPPPVGAQAPRAPSSRRNVAVLSHAEYVPTLTAAAALRVKAALSKAAWWPWPLTLKEVSESHVTWAISVPILVFLGLSVLDLGPMYATDRRQTKASLNAPAY